MKGAYLGPAFTDAEIEAFLQSHRRAVPSGSSARQLLATRRAAARRREGRRLVQRADGVRPARARRPQHPRRSAQPAHAGADEHQDQVPRGVPAIRAERACGSGCSDYFELDGDSPVHAARRAGQAGAPDPDDRRPQSSCGASTSSTSPRSDIPAVTHIDYSARIQTVSRETNPDYYDLHQGVRAADRLRGRRQHLVQRARRADRLHAGGRLPLLHADAHRRTWCWARSCSTRRSSPNGRRAAIGKQEFQLD